MFDILNESVELVNCIEGAKFHERREDTSIDDVFSYLRSCVKYLLFERDALKREVKYYRDLLEKRNQC